jgi:hypothetical protein
VSKILDARFNEQEMFHKLLVAWRGFPVGEANWAPYSVMDVDVPEMMAKFMESHDDTDMVCKDAISLRVLMWKCYALLRVRPLSISYADGFLVFLCGKVKYDKYG